jgi:hypothetical protein
MEKRPIKSAQPNLAQLPLLNPSSSLPTHLIHSFPCPLLGCSRPSPVRRRCRAPSPASSSAALPCLLRLCRRRPLLPPTPPASASSVARLCLLCAAGCPRGFVPRRREAPSPGGFDFGGMASISAERLRFRRHSSVPRRCEAVPRRRDSDFGGRGDDW